MQPVRRPERFLPAKQLAKLIEEKTIEIAPLAFMRVDISPFLYCFR